MTEGISADGDLLGALSHLSSLTLQTALSLLSPLSTHLKFRLVKR